MRIDQINGISYSEVPGRAAEQSRREQTVRFTSDLLSLSGIFSHLQQSAVNRENAAVATLRELYRSGSYRPDVERLSKQMIDRAFD